MNLHLTLLVMLPSLAFAETAPDNAAPGAAGVVETAILPTRLIADSPQEQIALLRTRIAINAKPRGPFGLSQDPGTEGPAFVLPDRSKVRKQVTPFADVVKAVPVAAVFPTEQEFMVGARTIRTGDTFPLVVRDEQISVRVESVRSRGVVFKNMKSGELATKRLDLLPDGITPGGKIQEIVGITPAGQASREPLHIDLPTFPPADPTRSP